jgi:hypothetical protein
MSDLYRFPKWLLQERFELEHYPGQGATHRFCVRLCKKDNYIFISGFGISVAEAAKRARKTREEVK